jgi:hypothetical protein
MIENVIQKIRTLLKVDRTYFRQINDITELCYFLGEEECDEAALFERLLEEKFLKKKLILWLPELNKTFHLKRMRKEI